MALTIDAELRHADILAIKRMIPHRYPMLMIDRVVNIAPGASAVGLKCVTVNEPFFDGHFPARPIMPGVFIVEAMAQTAAVLVVQTNDRIEDESLVYFMSIESAKFRSTVTPGDRLELHIRILRNRGKVWKFSGEGWVGDRLAAEAEFTAMIMPPDDTRLKD